MLSTTIDFGQAVELLRRYFGEDKGYAFALDAVYMPLKFQRNNIVYTLTGFAHGEMDLFTLTSNNLIK